MIFLKKIESFYILGYLQELIIEIWQFGFYFFFEIWQNLGPFFPWKILCIG
jgi:hypothetical protein